ncbi:MAG: GNAT family N-acetyltransferase [Gammaproteobacteria bacterium]|nr:GNAT family N-acetyltransferase [Gammaproteobacteria bacterium]
MSKDPAPIVTSGYVPGCIGRIAELHAHYYCAHAGFGVYFESKVARELGAFCENYLPQRDGLWLVMRDGSIEGSLAIDGTHAETQGAHLRWFILSDRLRGTGFGNQLLARALEFARDQDYHRITLWTLRRLEAARHLYLKFGFTLVEEIIGHQWGHEVVEQRYELVNR